MAVAEVPVRETRQRVLDAALELFGTRGFDGTSLDDVAAAVGLRKQTVLYYFPSKGALLFAVIDDGAADLVATFDDAVARAGPGWPAVEAIVRAVFRLALRRPALLGLVREVTRPGSASAERLRSHLEPSVERACAFLAGEMDRGRARRSDPRLTLVSAYATVIGVATEVEVLRAVGVEPTGRAMVRRRGELLAFLRAALGPAADAPPR